MQGKREADQIGRAVGTENSILDGTYADGSCGYENTSAEESAYSMERKLTRRERRAVEKAEREAEKARKIREEAERKAAERYAREAEKAARKCVRAAEKAAKKEAARQRAEKQKKVSRKKSHAAGPVKKNGTGNACGRAGQTGQKTKKEKQISAQQSIPYREMAKDGICRVQDKYYSKTIRFYDINYQLGATRSHTNTILQGKNFVGV